MQGVGRHQIGHARRDRQRARLWPDGGRDDDPERGRRRLRRMARVSRRWLITGVSGGLGRALAEAADRKCGGWGKRVSVRVGSGGSSSWKKKRYRWTSTNH